MSRTYRKSSITEKQSLVQYINKTISYLSSHDHYHEYYLTKEGQKAYDKAIEEWGVEYYRWYSYPKLRTRTLPPTQPVIWNYKNARVVFKETDYDKEIKDATEEYNCYKRDGRFYDGSLDREYRKHCAKELRCFNRALARKIIKEDESWEQKPYPDTYLGKKHIWDYF